MTHSKSTTNEIIVLTRMKRVVIEFCVLVFSYCFLCFLGERKIEQGVTVGVRQFYPDGKVHCALYLSVPARALHARPVLEALDLRPVSCTVVCAHTIA